jgi:hypothetical protein
LAGNIVSAVRTTIPGIGTGNPTSRDTPAVKALSGKSHVEVLEMVDDFRKNYLAIEPGDAVDINLSNEFSDVLSLGGSGMAN